MNKSFASYLRREAGGMTLFGLFIFSASLLMSAYAIDVGRLEQQRTLMQITADSVAHDALVVRELETEGNALAAAIARAEAIMSQTEYGEVVDPAEVVFGVWDEDTRTFTPQAGSRKAVQVLLRQTDENENPISTYLMKLVGIGAWDVVVQSTFATYQPPCMREGFVAEGIVDIQSNNAFTNGFCIHSNTLVSLNSNNYFEPGTVVSMPDLDDLDLPASGYDTNEGLSEALREGKMNIRVLRRIQRIIDTVGDPSSVYYPSYLTSPVPVTLSTNRIDATDLQSGRVHYWNCNSGPGGTIDNDTLVTNVVIIADCEVKLGAGTAIQSAILLTTSTSNKSINASSGFRLGVDDGCAPGGGARIVSLGGMQFAANLEIYGSQLLAMGNVEFPANAYGIEGASIISNGVISGTANMAMSYCGNGGVDGFTAEYFQLVT